MIENRAVVAMALKSIHNLKTRQTSLFYISSLVTFFNDIVIIPILPFIGGIPPPSRGIVGKNRSGWSKTTVRSIRIIYDSSLIKGVCTFLC